jgi:uncharacterized membrane protein
MQLRNIQHLTRWLVLISFIAFGAHQLGYGQFVTRAVGAPPVWIPAQKFWADATGIAMIVLALAAGYGKRAAAISLGSICFLSALLLHLPRAMEHPLTGSSWVYFGKGLALAGCAFTVAAGLYRDSQALDRKWLLLYGKTSLGAFMVLSGILHYVYDVFVASLLPSSIPWHFFWAYFAGVLLILGGIGMALPRTTQAATLLSGVMILSWVPLVHIPLAFKDFGAAKSTVPVFEALAFGSSAILAFATEMCDRTTSKRYTDVREAKPGVPDHA